MIEKFASVLCSSNPPVVRDPRLLMDASGDVKIYYTPFEYINLGAKIVLVGITPGPTQMVNGNNEARRALLAGKSYAETIQAAKSVGAFSGEPMRSNLINQLNHWGFHKWLGLSDSADLFSTSLHLMQTTSLLRYPVFVRDDDYRGTPNMARHPLLRRYLLDNFAAEVGELKDAVFVGLGPKVQKVLDHLIQDGILKPDRVIGGMLHPSGNCTYRIKYLVGNRRGPVPHATTPAPYDQGRQSFQKNFLADDS
ncbi:MAG: hypothetical protein MUP44_11035 [Anaerolineales bacterium]|nr:hypothetical protein [Anaerolineales bacterium]